MLELKSITKIYETGSSKVTALDDVSVAFRDCEFVAILGPSGCGKTTLLNIIGGLDRYTSGELSVDGKPTSTFTERDFDAYRNKRIGFVFQSYNLIAHQTVLENVEIALSLSGVSGMQRKRRAMLALERVGLASHLHKKPNELSGGEMQRVAIARAIVNDPEIILADEPTGALDSKTGVQIMELLKELSKERLVIMVTHNDALAAAYANRTIKLFDSKIVFDSNPVKSDVETQKSGYKSIIAKNGKIKNTARVKKNKSGESFEDENKQKSSLGFGLALALSFKNLLTKKTRTVLTTLASSIGIIGLALVLALYNGLDCFLEKVQYDTLSSYPMYVSSSTSTDMSEYISIITDSSNYVSDPNMKDKIFVSHLVSKLKDASVSSKITQKFIDYVKNTPSEYVRDISFKYGTTMNVYKKKVVFSASAYGLSLNEITAENVKVSVGEYFKELIGGEDFILSQYDLVAGKFPREMNELCLVLDKNNRISDAMLSAFLMDVNASQKDKDGNYSVNSYEYDDFLGKLNDDGTRKESKFGTFSLALNDGLYMYNAADDCYKTQESTLLSQLTKPYNESIATRVVSELKDAGLPVPNCYSGEVPALDLKIVGILRLNEDTTTGSMGVYPIGYTSKLKEYINEQAKNSQVVKAQIAEIEKLSAGAEQCRDVLVKEGTLDDNGNDISYITSENAGKNKLKKLGYAELPNRIEFYASDFNGKIALKKYLAAFNEQADITDEERVFVTDMVSTVIDVLKTFIDTITYILLSLTAISLFVAAIMIAIITYVSVIERTREIGILRSIGARKVDIVGVFNAETIIIGVASGVLGIVLAVILQIPLNYLLFNFTGISSLAVLSPLHALLLVGVSVVVTLVSGMVPALLAAKKDPVKALRAQA